MKITGTCGFLSCICVLFTFLQSFNPVYAFRQRLLGAPSLLRHKRQVFVPDLQAGFAYLNRSVAPQLNQRIPDLGPWGQWTESSQCSRSCGGGIAYQERICLDVRADGRHSCVGSSRRYFSCNTEDCPQPSKDFRGEQCARFNSVPHKGRYYSWVPYQYAQSPCELYCKPQLGSFYARLDRRVIDGTRCRDDGSLDVCVDAQCMPVGCDRVLGSTIKEDECGVCGGDGNTCRFIHGIFDEDKYDVGYNDILLIPVGATSILIQQMKPTKNYLAIRNADGVFYLNGNYRIEFTRDISIAGTLFQYESKQFGFQRQDVLRARGPTSEPIFVVLLYQEQNLGIGYEYSIPVTTKSVAPDSYSWTFGDFEECSQTCGGGVQYRPVRCIRKNDRDSVDEGLCDPVLKPSINGTCNTQPCPSGWHIGDWSTCSSSCGGGTQFRLVFCNQATDGNAVVIPDDNCQEEKPLFMRACNTDTECPDWVPGEWSECDRTCGNGNQTRTVECSAKGVEDPLEEALCNADERPTEAQTCNLGPCEGVEWIVSDWSGCDGSCSPHMQSREVHCANEEGVVFPNDACEASKMPSLTQSCPKSSMCEPMWHTSEWTECSVDCGNGVQSRVVFCGVWEEDSVMKIDEDKCDKDKKFEDMQNCSSEACAGTWFTGPWNRCSVLCGGGERSRKILCFHEDEVVDAEQCNSEEQPFAKEPCNVNPCDDDEIMLFGGCKDSKHGCCPDGVTPAGFNDEDCPKMNISSSNSTCEEAEFGCCADNFTLALGPFRKGCPTAMSCNSSQHGCCPDLVTPATGPNFDGCNEDSICSNSTFGCCPDGLQAATGPELEGCDGNVTDCENTTFGCCPDGLQAATGPELEGCDGNVTDCENTTFGCCLDGLRAATGPELEGCGGNVADCENTTFGCCSDGLRAALGPDFAGCETEGMLFPDEDSSGDGELNATDCSNSTFGCCDDGITFAKDAVKSGCFDDESSGDGEISVPCEQSTFGCCPDNVTIAKGFDGEGCVPEDCSNSTFGCCPDNTTSATGLDNEGCFPEDCSNSTFGCCPDNTTSATGFDNEGCFPEDCSNSTFGCCPDNTTSATGFDNEGCFPEDCSNSTFGCCPDNTTSATGPDNEGCFPEDCSNSTFGCCPDNTTSATGPDNEGCFPEDCSNSTFGCCPDNTTSATGPDNEGCFPEDCSNSTFGCCPDNTTSATGPDNEGCFPEDCSNSTFGCCPDNSTSATGPDNEGCFPEDCSNSTFGCCPDNSTSATGPDYEGCVPEDCSNSTFGCCPDNTTTASGPDYGGCENVTSCFEAEFGCCEDNVTFATGENLEGCNATDVTSVTPEVLTTTAILPECVDSTFGCCPDEITPALGNNLEGCCFGMRFGCCPDNKTAALGPTFLGCGCQTYPYKCCPDEITPAQGFNYVGCKCEHFRYGCCQDKVTPATGPHYEGCVCHLMEFGCCPDGRTPMTNEKGDGCGCDSTRYGCCPDGITAATSFDLAGCPCSTLPYGCCPDGYTPARTPDLRECPCSAQRYGCCLDGVTSSRGPNYEGCPCITTRFGCCLDGQTAAQGPNLQGCPCDSSLYGCCADGYTPARGPKYDGCPDVLQPKPKISTEVCSMPQESGPCRNFTVMWYFNVLYGSCSRFWYGGCDGNGNKFTTVEDCEETCVKPDGPEACLLPKTVGSCSEKIPSWYYDAGSKECEAFTYGGCLGNNNRFVSKADCEQKCINLQPITPVDVCALPKNEGSCDNTVIQWYYNTEHSRCEQFYYGGCKGNANRFDSRRECEKSCLASVVEVTDGDICRLPQQVGQCSEFRERWYYDYEIGQCHRFLFSGCNGNENNFGSFAECEKQCAANDIPPEVPTELEFRTEYCFLSQDQGPCNQFELNWYYDSSDGVCKEFYFGGCVGNQNRFKTRKECETSCFKAQDVCLLPKMKGPCSGSFTQWYYDQDQEDCLEFLFTGCQGNGNRFNSKEGCYQQCKKDKLTTPAPPVMDDVCTLLQQPGPCLGFYRMWYYDNSDNICKSFVYGGCEGNGNRFEKRTECEAHCVKKTIKVTEPPPKTPPPQRGTNEDVCRLPVEPGPCNEAHPRWFYDAQTQSCLPFVFGGCDGNKNRFKTSEICLRFCTGIKSTSSQDFLLAVLTTTPAPTTQCPPSNCANIQCPYGIEESFDNDGCTTCRCSNPCEVHECPDGSRCAIDVVRTSREGIRTEPVCRRVTKPGECPSNSHFSSNAGDCETRCRDDADCRGEHKCCNNGCAFNCVAPADDLFIPATQPEPAHIRPGVNVTEGRVGEPAELPCDATGWPRPTVTWWRETTMLPLSSNRYEQLSSYSLLIRSVVYEDGGDYSCHAHNGIGTGALYRVTLVIDLRPDEDFSARDSEPQPPAQPDFAHSVQLQTKVTLTTTHPQVGSPLQVDCAVQGPSSGVRVTWTRTNEAVEEDDRQRLLSNHTLFITKAVESDSGEYRCTAEHSGLVSYSSVYVNVEASEDSDCVDNPQFKGCASVVQANYCNNKSYRQYCCASCLNAEKLRNSLQ